jgi:hypothetical protein
VQEELCPRMQIRQMESCPQDWPRSRLPNWTRHLRKCLGISQICCYLLRKWTCPNCWTRNSFWWWPLHWCLLESYWKSPQRCLQGSLRQ